MHRAGLGQPGAIDAAYALAGSIDNLALAERLAGLGS